MIEINENKEKLKKLLKPNDPMPNKLQEEISKKGIKECIGKLHLENNKFGTCFFIKLPILGNNETMNVLMTNNHIICEEDIEKLKKENKTLNVEINEKEKKIDLSAEKFYHSNKDFDFTIIEIKEYDFIDNFLEIDQNYLSEIYINKRIYIQQFPQQNKDDSSEYKGILSNSWGKIKGRAKNNFIVHDCMTYEGSSGSPIILVEGHKVVGLHRGYYELENKKNDVNLGIYLKDIIEITKKEKKIIVKKECKECFCKSYKIIYYNVKIILKILIAIFLFYLLYIVFDIFFLEHKLYYPNGNLYYFGYTLFKIRHGVGKSYYKNGNIEYNGDWKYDLKDGNGTLYENDAYNTKIYTGSFEKGFKSGFGTQYYKNGNMEYNGEWQQNKFHGYGEYYYPNKKLKYEGFFAKGRKNGTGTLYNEDGSLNFTGIWIKNHFFNGTLFYDYNNKTKYIGLFSKNHMFKGVGKYFYDNKNNSVLYSGTFKKGLPDEYGISYYENGNIRYKGFFKDGKFHGNGSQYYANEKLEYNGTFKNGNKNGAGIYYFENSKKKYIGEFKNNLFEGKGTLYDGISIICNGTFIKGVFKNDTLTKEIKEEDDGVFTKLGRKVDKILDAIFNIFKF